MRDYKSPLFQHRHYAEIAALLAKGKPVWVDEFVTLFARDNPRFDAARFRAAASGNPSNGKDKR